MRHVTTSSPRQRAFPRRPRRGLCGRSRAAAPRACIIYIRQPRPLSKKQQTSHLTDLQHAFTRVRSHTSSLSIVPPPSTSYLAPIPSAERRAPGVQTSERSSAGRSGMSIERRAMSAEHERGARSGGARSIRGLTPSHSPSYRNATVQHLTENRSKVDRIYVALTC